LHHGDANVIFDRGPIDVLAYILLQDDADSFELGEWLPRIRGAVQTLDLVVFIPIEARDRIALLASDDDGVPRSAVHKKLQEILLDDPFGFSVDVLDVEGATEGRARMVLQRMRRESR